MIQPPASPCLPSSRDAAPQTSYRPGCPAARSGPHAGPQQRYSMQTDLQQAAKRHRIIVQALTLCSISEPFSSGLVVEVEDDQGGGSYGGDRGGGQADFAEGFEVFE